MDECPNPHCYEGRHLEGFQDEVTCSYCEGKGQVEIDKGPGLTAGGDIQAGTLMGIDSKGNVVQAPRGGPSINDVTQRYMECIEEGLLGVATRPPFGRVSNPRVEGNRLLADVQLTPGAWEDREESLSVPTGQILNRLSTLEEQVNLLMDELKESKALNKQLEGRLYEETHMRRTAERKAR